MNNNLAEYQKALEIVRDQQMDKEELEAVLITAYKVIDEFARMNRDLQKENTMLESQVKHWKQEQEYAAKNHLDLLLKQSK
jgi:hypothetical protein